MKLFFRFVLWMLIGAVAALLLVFLWLLFVLRNGIAHA
jgi:hypothetical protein